MHSGERAGKGMEVNNGEKRRQNRTDGCFSWFPNVQVTVKVFVMDRSAHAIVRAARMKQKMHTKLTLSPSNGITTLGQVVPALTL